MTQFFLVLNIVSDFSVILLFSDSSREIFNMVVRQGTIESTATMLSDSIPEEELNSPVKYVQFTLYSTVHTIHSTLYTINSYVYRVDCTNK